MQGKLRPEDRTVSEQLSICKYLVWSWSGGVTFAKIVCGCACRMSKNLTFSIAIFGPITHLSVYLFFFFLIEKHLILPELGVFYNNLLKIHPVFEFGLFVSDENPLIAIPNFV